MNQFPLVSIILIAYNIENFLEKSIESCMHQDYINLEIIIVIDGSPDACEKIALEQAKLDKRIKVIVQKNSGPGASRNTGIENSSGDFIVFLDGDDFLSRDFVSYMMGIYDKTHADICLSKNIFTTKDNNQVTSDKLTIYSSEEGVAEFLYPRLRMGVWNKLWKRDLIEKKNFRFLSELTTAEGLTFMTNVGQYANKIAAGERKVYCYRLDNPNSLTTKADVEGQGIASLEAMDIIEKNLNMSSKVISNAMNYQRWGTSAYALRQIIDANSEHEYAELYIHLIKYIRINSLFMLKTNVKVPLRTKIIAILRFISPVLLTKYSLYLRDRHLNKNI